MESARKGLMRYELYNENFSRWFNILIEGITAQQQNMIPKDLAKRLYDRSKNPLQFHQQMYLISAVFGIPVVVLIGSKGEDGEGVKIPDLKEMLKTMKGKGKSTYEQAEQMFADFHFAVAGQDMIQGAMFTRLICATDIYKSVIPAVKRKTLGGKAAKFEEHRSALRFMIRMFTSYESNKKRISTDYGFSMAEWYALLFFYGEEKKGTTFYRETFKYAHAASQSLMKNALTRLVRDGYLTARGATHSRMYTTTAKGDDAILHIMDKLILNF